MILFAVAMLALLAAPIAGFALTSVLERRSASARRAGWRATLLVAGLTILVFATSWSFAGVLADAGLLGLAYASYAAWVFAAQRLRPRPLGLGVFALGLLPIAFGYASATIGVLGVALVLGDIAPIHEGQVNDRFCRVATYGNATTSYGGYVVRLFERPRLLPFVEHEVLRFELESNHAAERLAPDQLCERAAAGNAGGPSPPDASAPSA